MLTVTRSKARWPLHPVHGFQILATPRGTVRTTVAQKSTNNNLPVEFLAKRFEVLSCLQLQHDGLFSRFLPSLCGGPASL